LRRAVRRVTRSLDTGATLTHGADVVIDCVGNEASLAEALSVVRPGGTVTMVGMPGRVSVDLTPLWHREARLIGTYAYDHATFARAFDLVADAGLGCLVSAL